MSESVWDFTVWELADKMELREWAEEGVRGIWALLESTYRAEAEAKAIEVVHLAMIRAYYNAWNMPEEVKWSNRAINKVLGAVRPDDRRKIHPLLKIEAAEDGS